VSHPDRLGKYQITEVLGEGAMGVVYKGFDPDIKRVVALKTIRGQIATGGDSGASASARFRNEAQAAGRLTHPGIVAVYEFGIDQEIAYIAMEFVEGRSLAHYMASKVRFTDDDIPGVMCQLLDALDHAHEQGVWHRDIKPANIIMARNGKLKIADFGIARIEDTALTQTNVMIGTPSYMAPEQFLGGQMDRRVDVYASGVLLYLMLTGRPPFTGSAEQLLYKVVHEAPVLPSQLPDVLRPPFYDPIIATALAKDPAQRFPTAAAFKKAIERGVGEPFDTTVWERTLISAPDKPTRADASPPTGGTTAPTGSSGWTQAPTNWNKDLLSEAEHSLALHVGPMASVLVRRAARESHDLPGLYSKLAEQVTSPEARSQFLERAAAFSRIQPVTPPTAINARTQGSSGTSLRAPTQAVSAPSALVSDAMLDAAEKLLARHVGPIARLLVKKAAANSRERAAVTAQLLEAVTDAAAREKLRAELDRLV
jgi:serine/threonine protein kinase